MAASFSSSTRLNSVRFLMTLASNFFKGLRSRIEPGTPTREVLPALDDDIDKDGIQFHQARSSTGLLTGDHGGASASEQVQDDISSLAAVADRALDQLDRLLRGMLVMNGGVPAGLPDIGLVPVPVPRMPGPIEDELVLRPIVGLAEAEMFLVPHNTGGGFQAARREHRSEVVTRAPREAYIACGAGFCVRHRTGQCHSEK